MTTVPVNFQFKLIEKGSDRFANMHLILHMEPNTVPMAGHGLYVEHVFAPLVKNVICCIKNGKYHGILAEMGDLETDKFDDEIQSYLDVGFTCERSEEYEQLLPSSESDTAVPV